MDYGRALANRSLEIGAIKLNTENPFQWASGYRMPIYNDNRMLLGSFTDRMLISNGIYNLMQWDKGFQKVAYVAGTSTAGIAPAACVADHMMKPLVIIQQGVAFAFPVNWHTNLFNEVDAIASTCPWAIPFGVVKANQKEIPFMYVRQSQKSHGMQQQIEGIPLPGKRIALIDFYRGESYADNAVRALEEKGMHVVEVLSKDVSDHVRPVSVSNKPVVEIEDLVSTAESSVKEIKTLQDMGAYVSRCYSIFSYGFEKAHALFKEVNCTLESALEYDTLLSEAKEGGKFTELQLNSLAEWRDDPFSWGAKHGFPKVEKK
jgi:orotate phosphoribosyltransferase